ncbi:SDR family oxidoreductase [Achromobacter sp. SD115]|uniref:SDR family oxidoreductase n=1 Tax=Achromobacter sp. SD115 TaxID=2782011 RepID=UPI001A970C8A|nr:SDR family oxidoreductase [Achromobacter sp. SD115]MBO1014317.1 SDR family oxidoreductase [Achromobacter sp. SD115]
MTGTSNGLRKAAIVFGGSRGIGAAIGRRLAADGADVAFTYLSAPERARETAAAIEECGAKALAIHADSANAEAIRLAAARAVEHFGRLDVVVVNAGILKLGGVADVSVADLDQMLAVNVRGVFLAIQAGAAHLERGGRIVTIGSNVAARIGGPAVSVYAMTKAAVATMVKGIALDLAPRGITINNVQPGPIQTDMTVNHLDAVIPLIPLQRAGSADEIASLVAWLASAEFGYMTGASLTADGGMTL